jgi:hypothetical protein
MFKKGYCEYLKREIYVKGYTLTSASAAMGLKNNTSLSTSLSLGNLSPNGVYKLCKALDIDMRTLLEDFELGG